MAHILAAFRLSESSLRYGNAARLTRTPLSVRATIRRAAAATALVSVVVLSNNALVHARPVASPSPNPEPADSCGGPGRLLATANRPTIGYSACAVKKGTAVFELGYQNQSNGTPTAGSIQAKCRKTF